MRRLAGAGRAAAASGGTGGRAAALARSLRCAAGGLLLAFAALLALPPQAQAQTVETLVSNTGQTAGDQNGLVGTIAGSNWLAGQGFTTGDNTDGYTLSSVQLYIKYFDASDVANVSIYSSVSDNPGSSLYVLTSPASIVNERLNTFTAPANATLEKDTEYIVVVEASGGGWFALPLTSSGAEDSGKANGWSISDAHPVKQNLLAWRTEPRVLRISVMGTVNGGTAATGKPSISGTAAGRPDADGIDKRHHGRRRAADRLHLPVGAGGRHYRDRHLGCDIKHLHAVILRRGQDDRNRSVMG